MAGIRTGLDDFALANSIYSGATVSIFVVDPVSLKATTALAPVYGDLVSTTQIANPQTLDTEGKWQQPVYIDQNVSMLIGGPYLADHQTAVTGPFGHFRGQWVAGQFYDMGDTISDAAAGTGTYNIFQCQKSHLSGAFSNDLAAGFWLIYVDVTSAFGSALFTSAFAALPVTLPIYPGVIWNNGGSICVTDGGPYAALPTTLPAGPGIVWNNGGSLCITPGSPAGAGSVPVVAGTLPSYPTDGQAYVLTVQSSVLSWNIPAASSGVLTTTIYTASGSIAITDALALINSPSATSMTIAAGTIDGHQIAVSNYGNGITTITLQLRGISQSIPLMPGNVLNVAWNIGLSTYILTA